jgi:hypothetical protein
MSRRFFVGCLVIMGMQIVALCLGVLTLLSLIMQ